MFANVPFIVVLSNLSTFLLFLISSLLVRAFRTHKYLFFLWLFFTFSLLTEFIVHYYHLQGQPNAWIVHFYTLGEYVLIVFILSLWQQRPRIKRLMQLSIIFYFGIYSLVKILGFENFEANTINFITRPISLLLMTAFILYTLHQFWINTSISLARDFRFWTMLALSAYYAGSILVIGLMFTKEPTILLFLAYTHVILNILKNTVITVSLFYMLINLSKSENA